jgi:hypothetical protein
VTPGGWLPNGGRPAGSTEPEAAEPEAPGQEAPEQGEHLSTDDQTDWLAAPHAAAEAQTDALAGDGFAVPDDLADEWGDEAGPGAAAVGSDGPAQPSGAAGSDGAGSDGAGSDGAGSDGAAAAVAAGLLAAGDAAAVQRVAAAVGALDEMAGLPVGEHVRWYDALHGELSDALASIDEV